MKAYYLNLGTSVHNGSASKDEILEFALYIYLNDLSIKEYYIPDQKLILLAQAFLSFLPKRAGNDIIIYHEESQKCFNCNKEEVSNHRTNLLLEKIEAAEVSISMYLQNCINCPYLHLRKLHFRLYWLIVRQTNGQMILELIKVLLLM